MRALLVIVLVVLPLAGCAAPALSHEATFAAVPGESGKYTLKVLNATLANVTVEVAGPSRPNPPVLRDDDGVLSVRRETAGLVVLVLRSDVRPGEAAPTFPVWTVAIDGLRKNTYTLEAQVTGTTCSDICREATYGVVRNAVTVT